MDDDSDFQKLKILLIVGVVFLCSCWSMWTESKYLLRGKKAEATIDAIQQREVTSGRRRRQRTVLDLHFHYIDQATGNMVIDDLMRELGATEAVGDKLMIQYLPGVADSAREGANIFMIVIFVVASGAMVWSVVNMAREANAPIPTARKKRSGRSRAE